MLKKLKRIARRIPFAKKIYKIIRNKRLDLKKSTTNKKIANNKTDNHKPRGNLSAKQLAELTPDEHRRKGFCYM